MCNNVFELFEQKILLKIKLMEVERKAQYEQMMSEVRNSPVETVEFEGNTYHFKLDYKLPYGECHYSRIFLKLIYLKECLGIIKQGDVLLETTSGSGGRAAAAVATALGYQIKIAVPAGGEKARERAIEKAGAELILTPAEVYVNGFPEFIKNFLVENPKTKYLNHAMGDIFGRGFGVNNTSINAFRPFVDEVIETGVQPDVVICPLGNGTTTLPMVTEFKSLFRKSEVFGFESVMAANSYRKYYPGNYESLIGLNPDMFLRHDLPGSSPSHTDFPMPALEVSALLLDGISLVTSDFVDDNFLNVVGFKPSDKSEEVVKWDDLDQSFLKDFGRTGKAGFAVAVSLARKREMSGKHFLIPVFDAARHYDS